MRYSTRIKTPQEQRQSWKSRVSEWMNKHIKNEPSRSLVVPDHSFADFLASSFVPLSPLQCTKREALKPMLLPPALGTVQCGQNLPQGSMPRVHFKENGADDRPRCRVGEPGMFSGGHSTLHNSVVSSRKQGFRTGPEALGLVVVFWVFFFSIFKYSHSRVIIRWNM